MISIQRQFSLPNCVLILEGINTEGKETPRPLLSTLTRFECHFGNESQIIQGGRELLNLLAQRVHTQAQSLLSGINVKPLKTSSTEGLTLKAEGQGQFRLSIADTLLQPSDRENAPTSDTGSGGIELKLNSVQLFDLVEAFDQLMEDTQTLPDLALQLSPLSRKDALSQGGTGQKFIPVSLGIASLALITATSFVIPAPEITRPTAPETKEKTESPLETKPNQDSSVPSGQPPQTSEPSNSKPLETKTDSTTNGIEGIPEAKDKNP